MTANATKVDAAMRVHHNYIAWFNTAGYEVMRKNIGCSKYCSIGEIFSRLRLVQVGRRNALYNARTLRKATSVLGKYIGDGTFPIAPNSGLQLDRVCWLVALMSTEKWTRWVTKDMERPYGEGLRVDQRCKKYVIE